MIADEAPSAALMPAVSMLRDLRDKIGHGARGQRHLAIDADALRHLDTAEIERQHQRQQHREFHRRHAALVLGEIAKGGGPAKPVRA